MLEEIAKIKLDIETLNTRRSDSLDFHDLAVWSIKTALRRAYMAGYEQADEDRKAKDAAEDDANLVPPNFACPKCGQRNMDELICDDDGEHVACQTCGTNYAVMQIA